MEAVVNPGDQSHRKLIKMWEDNVKMDILRKMWNGLV
jgi:hypothetical protein